MFKYKDWNADTNKAVMGKTLNKATISQIEVEICDIDRQREIVEILDKVSNVLEGRNVELSKLDDLIKARFVEMFGDLKSNSKGWQIVGFNDCANIDTNMIHDFKGYEDYPHIGIDSIEKDTGRLIGYRTIAEDGVISGKYLFTPKHIIYSKIRPNLNKVALPDFDGLCSADAYPILVKDGMCNREYFGYTLRSKYFLDYILALSNRTNLPKVNKNQVEGFTLPLPPIGLQNQFADFVAQVDKSKLLEQIVGEYRKYSRAICQPL
jgi:type I restriction enzyme S subunit